MKWKDQGYDCPKPEDWKNGGWKPKFGPDGDFDYVESRHTQDFKFHPMADTMRGVYNDISRRSDIYYGRHERLEDLISTITHEDKHASFDADINLLNDDLVLNWDIDQEHRAIAVMQWMEQEIDTQEFPHEFDCACEKHYKK